MARLPLSWWKILTVILLFYTVFMGFLYEVPRLPILNESVRNLHFHVPMWMCMFTVLGISALFACINLCKPSAYADNLSVTAAETGLVFGLIGISTGMLWARYTWGDWWSGDPKQNATAIALLIYAAYHVLRNSMPDGGQRGRISAVYNIFAFATLVPLLYILPRLSDDSLHPGSKSVPAINPDIHLRMVFLPALLGWTLLAWWITTLGHRLRMLQHKKNKADIA